MLLKTRRNQVNIKELTEVKKYAEKADEVWRSNKRSYLLSEWVSLLNRVNENIRITSLNVFVFLKAFPLTDLVNQTHVGTVTQRHNNFKSCVIQNMRRENKVTQVKFDVLTRESLKLIKNHGCRVLHLSSDEFRDLQLWAERKYRELDLIKI